MQASIQRRAAVHSPASGAGFAVGTSRRCAPRKRSAWASWLKRQRAANDYAI